jgi:hypothetical protein
MTEADIQTTIVSWRPDYDAESLMVSDWIDTDGWDFVGCVVDIQLRRANGDYFFVKYVGSVEGIDEDAVVEVGEEKHREIYHFGVEKLNGKRWLFRPHNIHCIRNHHSSKAEKESMEESKSVFPFASNRPITKDLPYYRTEYARSSRCRY